MVEIITDANFDEKVKQAELPVLVDFYADWCGPCKMMSPAVDAVAEKYAGRLVTGKLNVDENMDTAMANRVVSIPFLGLFRGGELVEKIVGAVPAEALESMIERHLD